MKKQLKLATAAAALILAQLAITTPAQAYCILLDGWCDMIEVHQDSGYLYGKWDNECNSSPVVAIGEGLSITGEFWEIYSTSLTFDPSTMTFTGAMTDGATITSFIPPRGFTVIAGENEGCVWTNVNTNLPPLSSAR